MEDEATPMGAAAALQSWAELAEQQSNLFINTANECESLRARVSELEQELSVWKIAFQTSRSEKEELRQKVIRLERNVTSLRNDNAMIVCLIDGDGHLFSQELISQGQLGGRKAAKMLIQGIMNYISNEDDHALARAQITVTIFCNMGGLEDTFDYHNLCSREDFRAFILGFNQAAPLINVIDAGNGKEAADAKIKENLRVWSKFPQTARIIFGGAHDNGYTTTLAALENEGLLHKVVLLQGYRDVAAELQALKLPQFKIDDVFLEDKLPAKSYKKPLAAQGSSEQISQANTDPPIQGLGLVDVTTLAKAKLRPPPCNRFYLHKNGCQHGQRCNYGHGYNLSKEALKLLRKNAQKTPCSFINQGQTCPDGVQCIHGHLCPRGPSCVFYKQSKCKFIGKDAHSKINTLLKPPKKTQTIISGGIGIGDYTLSPQSVASSDLSSSSDDSS